nr:hypothetical protein [Tanacetum cinerariifolium]
MDMFCDAPFCSGRNRIAKRKLGDVALGWSNKAATEPDCNNVDFYDLRYDYGQFYVSKLFFGSTKIERVLSTCISKTDSREDDIEKRHVRLCVLTVALSNVRSNHNRYHNDDDDSDMEASFDGITREEKHWKLGDVDYNEELHIGSMVTLISVGVTQRLQRLIALSGLLYDLSKPVEKTTYVSLASGFIPGLSSGVRSLSCLPFESFTMSLEESKDPNLLDAESFDHVLEASSLPNFDMHPHKSSLTETNVKWLTKCYGIPADLHPRVASEDAPTSLKKWKDKFFLVDRRAALIAMAWRHHDSSVADPFPKPNEYNASNVAKLREVVIALHKPHLSLLYVVGISQLSEWLSFYNFPISKVVRLLLVLDDKEKKKRKTKAKVAIFGAETQAKKVVRDKGVGKEGARKKKRVCVGTLVHPASKHVFSPIPLNHAKPLKILDTEQYVSPNASVGRMDQLLKTVEKPVRNKVVPEVEATIKQSWKLLCQSAQQQANTLLHFEALTKEHIDLVYGHESCKDVKARYKECKKELAKAQVAYDEKTSAYDQLSKNYDGALTREKCLQDRLEELEDEKKKTERDMLLKLTAEYKQSLGEAFSLTIGEGFIDGISIGGKDPDIQAILKATPNVNLASFDIFMETYEKLFDNWYPYVDKVARMHLLDPSGLQNVMPDKTDPIPGGGPRDTPTALYA